MKRYWGGVTTLGELAVLIRHIVQWTETKFESLRGSRYLHDKLLELVGGSISAITAEKLRSLIPQFSKDYIERCQSGIIDESHFVEDWHISQFFKKFRFECCESEEDAAQGFLARNTRAREVSEALHLRPDHITLLRMRELLNLALPFSQEKDGRFGPGATMNAGSTWAEKLKWLAASSAVHRVWERRSSDEPAVCRLHVVPKDFTKSRSITIERCEAQWSQQGARSTILSSIHHGILRNTVMDLDNHLCYDTDGGVTVYKPNLLDSVRRQQDRCCRGARDGSLCTLDLSDASDTMLRDVVFATFPAWVCQLLEPSRAIAVEVPHHGLHELFMYAGMGNATTFVVETLYFWALLTAIAEQVHVGKPLVTVFGDDIVMNGRVARNRWFQSKLLQFGLKLNLSKSGLSAGPGFREACGLVSFRDQVISSTFRFYGYAATREGAIGYCDITSRLLSSTNPVLNALGQSLLAWSGAPKAPLVSVYDTYGASLCYRIPERGSFNWVVPVLPDRKSVRWNRFLQRTEIRLPTIQAKTARITIKDPIWGPGVIRSWGYWAYQLSLHQCAPILNSRVLPKAREVSYAIPHRTKVRNLWIPCRFTTFKVM